MFLSLAVCPTGWGFEPSLEDEIARLAVETGVWPLKEAREGKVRHTYIPSSRLPVEEYLKPQRRFRHLFHPERLEDDLRTIQENVDFYWETVAGDELAEPTGHTDPPPSRS